MLYCATLRRKATMEAGVKSEIHRADNAVSTPARTCDRRLILCVLPCNTYGCRHRQDAVALTLHLATRSFLLTTA